MTSGWAGVVMRVLAVVAIASCPAAARGQTQTVDLTGRVRDAQGAPVAGATVRVMRGSGSALALRVTAADGSYEVRGLQPGAIVVQADRPGFRRAVQSVMLAAAANAEVDLTLEVAGVDEAVVVTAAGVPQDLRETSKAITSIDAADVGRRHQVSIAEIVRIVPGVQVRDTGGPGQLGTLRIRGLRSDAAAVLVDGYRFRDAASPQSDATAFFSNLSFVAGDRVEVLRGSGSSLYGTNAVGGAVNVVSASGGGPFAATADVEYGSLGQTRARGSVTGSAAGGRLAFSAGGLGWDVADGVDGDDPARTAAAQGLVRFQPDAATTLSVRYYGSRDRVASNASPSTSTIPAANVPDGPVVDAVALPPDQLARLDRGQPFDVGAATFVPGRNDPDSLRRSAFQTLAVRLERRPSPAVAWQASYQRLHTSRQYNNGPLGPGFQTTAENVSEFTGDIDTIDLRATMDSRPWLTVTAGYELEREAYVERLDDNLPPPVGLVTETRVSQVSHAVFGAAQFAWLDRRLQVGVAGRAQIFRPGAPVFSTAGLVSPYDGLDLDAPPRALTGDVSAAYFVAATGTKVRAHVGNAYRAPSLYERFGGGFFTDPASDTVLFSPFGDPRLEPDRYRTVDAGVDQYLWGTRALVSATVFGIDVRSLTDFDFTGGIDPTTDPFGRFIGYINGSGGFSRGVELGLDARPLPGLRIQAAYTYTDAETDEDISVPGFFKVPNVFAHMTTVVVGHTWRDTVEATGEIVRASSSYSPFFANGSPRAYRFDGFTTVGLVLSYRVARAAGAPARVYVRLENLLDERYYPGGWRAPGRTGALGVSFGF